ncbi:MAG: ribosome silencing factor [Thermoleophilia bacterium]|jgi:ribosome-associated protein|nr:ribosome silencing factor [Thermoleophilia bacterium]
MGGVGASSLTDIHTIDRGAPSDTQELALGAAAIAYDKKAEDIMLLDMRGLVDYTDFLVICTGRTPRQAKSIAQELRHRLKKDFGVTPRRVEGEKEGDWILVDALDIVVHVFTPEAREFYRLDRLWREAPQEHFVGDGPPGEPEAAASPA